jgi:hypothetical protein
MKATVMTMAQTLTNDELIAYLRNSKGWPTLGNAAADRIEELEDKLENLIAGAETVLEEWDRGDEAAFREAIEGMRVDVSAAKGGK